MSDITMEDWLVALTSILEDLENSQYKKMLEFLEKIPRREKTGKSKEKMPSKIIEHYGLLDSISVIDAVMQKIPRKDPPIQDLLRPFVDKLRNIQEKENQGKKRKREEDEELKITDQQKSGCKERKILQEKSFSWKKSICDLKSSGILETEGIIGKVIQKSVLRPYQTKDKAKRFFFYVAVADETASVQLTAYGKDRYREIQEENSYLFKNLKIDSKNEVRVTAESEVAQTRPVDVSEELKMEAQKLIYPESPLCSIEKAKESAEKTELSVRGTVQEIHLVEKVKVPYQRQKVNKQRFQLKDDTGSISICMWAAAIRLCKGLSVGDVVMVTNLKTKLYNGEKSLNSITSTRIDKIQSVGIQNVRIEIIGIKKATKKETHLNVDLDDRVHTLVVASRLLAKAFDVKLEGDFKGKLLDKMPLSADVEIEGNTIKTITAA